MAKARVCSGPSLGFRVYGLGLLVLLFSDALVPVFFQHHHHGDDDDDYYLVMAAKMLILLSLLVVLILQQCLEPLFWYTYYILKPYPKASLPHREPKDVLSWNLTRPADLEAHCKPEPQTPNPKPSTLAPKPLTPKPRNPKPQTLTPKPLNPKPQTLNPKP